MIIEQNKYKHHTSFLLQLIVLRKITIEISFFDIHINERCKHQHHRR